MLAVPSISRAGTGYAAPPGEHQTPDGASIYGLPDDR